MTLSDNISLARDLFGRDRQSGGVTRITGTATADSHDGTVTVELDDGEVIEVGAIGSVSEGDTVTVHVQNGVAQVIAAEGWGDALEGAVTAAEAAAAIAEAKADEAIASADTAASAAASAQTSADSAAGAAASAQTSADTAISDAATAKESADNAIEDARVAGVAASVAQAAARAARGDDPDYMNHWFYYDENGAHVLGNDNGYRTDVASDAWEIVDTSTMTPVVGIGATGSHFGDENGMHVALDATSLALKNGNARVAYIAIDNGKSKLYIERAVIVDDLQFVDGNWKWYGRSNGNLALRWMGGTTPSEERDDE